MDRRAQRDSAAEAFNLERGAAMLPTIRNILQSKGVEQRHTGAEARQMEKTTANRPAPPKCYIDGRACTGARFSFCDDCKMAQQKNAREITEAKSPASVKNKINFQKPLTKL